MCGIIGIVGNQPVADRLVESLKRLEYRGYDSAGIAGQVDGVLQRRRAPGKLRELESVLAHEPLIATTGIGHTRWATHGAPTLRNAHPHIVGRVAVVHNGIIENFAELRSELLAQGYAFRSETDTEVIAHLVPELHVSEPFLNNGLATQGEIRGHIEKEAVVRSLRVRQGIPHPPVRLDVGLQEPGREVGPVRGVQEVLRHSHDATRMVGHDLIRPHDHTPRAGDH